MIKLFWSTE